MQLGTQNRFNILERTRVGFKTLQTSKLLTEIKMDEQNIKESQLESALSCENHHVQQTNTTTRELLINQYSIRKKNIYKHKTCSTKI